MKKQLLAVGIIVLLIAVGFSGCAEKKDNSALLDTLFPYGDTYFFDSLEETIMLLSSALPGIETFLNYRINYTKDTLEIINEQLLQRFRVIQTDMDNKLLNIAAHTRVSDEYTSMKSEYTSVLLRFRTAFSDYGWTDDFSNNYLRMGINHLINLSSIANNLTPNPLDYNNIYGRNVQKNLDYSIDSLERVYALEQKIIKG